METRTVDREAVDREAVDREAVDREAVARAAPAAVPATRPDQETSWQDRRRARAPDPQNHHLWRNGRRWWIAFTVHTPDGRGLRVRRSLGTTDVREARLRRDEIFERARTSPELLLVER
jgi:hypothetical protein